MRVLLLIGAALLAAPLTARAQDRPEGHGPPGGDSPDGGRRGGAEPGARLFISPMGEPFRGADPIGLWFDGVDANHDGVVTLIEFLADADRFFTRLDRAHDGEIDPDDITYYESVLAPEIRTGGDAAGTRGVARSRGGGSGDGGRHGGGGGGRRGGGQYGGGQSGGSGAAGEAATPAVGAYDETARGAARFGFFSYPEPVTAADANLNRGVDRGEFRTAAQQRFAALDKRGDNRLTRDELPRLSPPPAGRGGREGWYGGRHRGAGASAPPPPQQDDRRDE